MGLLTSESLAGRVRSSCTRLFFMAPAADATSATSSLRAIDRLRKAANFEPIRQVLTLTDGDEFVFYCRPLTAAEREQAQKNSKGTNDFAMQLLVMKAENEDGEKLFKPGDIAALKREVEDEILQKMILCVLRPNGEEEIDLKSSGD